MSLRKCQVPLLNLRHIEFIKSFLELLLKLIPPVACRHVAAAVVVMVMVLILIERRNKYRSLRIHLAI